MHKVVYRHGISRLAKNSEPIVFVNSPRQLKDAFALEAPADFPSNSY